MLIQISSWKIRHKMQNYDGWTLRFSCRESFLRSGRTTSTGMICELDSVNPSTYKVFLNYVDGSDWMWEPRNSPKGTVLYSPSGRYIPW